MKTKSFITLIENFQRKYCKMKVWTRKEINAATVCW